MFSAYQTSFYTFLHQFCTCKISRPPAFNFDWENILTILVTFGYISNSIYALKNWKIGGMFFNG